MRIRFRHLVSTSYAVVLLAIPGLAFGDDVTSEPALGMKVSSSNGRTIVTTAAPNVPVVLSTAPAASTSKLPTLDQRMPEPIQSLVHSISKTHGVDPRLVAAVMKVESNYNRWARSSKGALGLMQLIPATGARFGVRDFF